MAPSPATADASPEDAETAPGGRNWRRWGRLAGGAVASASVLGVTFVLTAEQEPEPEVLFGQSLDMLEARDWARAHNVGVYLRERQYDDLDFGGGVSFVLGESAFQLGDGFSLDAHTRDGHYREAARELATAAQDGLPTAYRAAWTRSLGLALYRLRRLAEAEPRLAEAAESGDAVCLLALGRCRLVPAAEVASQAGDVASMCETLLSRDDLPRPLAVEAALLKIDAMFEQDQLDAIAATLSETDWLPLPPDAPELTLRRARLALARGEANEADRLTGELLSQSELPPARLREAAYWSARAAERDGRETEAILRYRAVLDDYDAGQETIVAAVRLAELLRGAPRVLFEDALRAYARAVQIESRPEHYRNRYMPLAELRERVRSAWQDWLAAGQFEWAIRLAEQMAPLFEKHDAAELAALAAHERARDLLRQYEAADAETRDLLRGELFAAWRESGEAYGRLADWLVTRAGYQDALWLSFQHLREGHDFRQARSRLQTFLDTQTQTRRPQALVEYGRLLVDLHEPGDTLLQDAESTFTGVLENYPTSDAAFDAVLARGHCLMEQNRPEEAAADWQSILASPLLTPKSETWQEALVSLGSLLFHLGELESLAARRAEQAGEIDESERLAREANAHWSDAASQLTGYLARTDYTRQSAQARFWLAKSLQRVTELPASQLDSAETNNARIELQRNIDASLLRSIAELQTLVRDLDPRAEQGRLDPLEARLLRDCTFEIAHAMYARGDRETAIDLYADAINRFPNDPQVLLAYVQIAACHEQLGRRTEAISFLERAQLIRGQFGETVFDDQLSSLSGPEWQVWLDRSVELLDDGRRG